MMRDHTLSASQAARDRGVTVRDFWKYIPKAFKRDSHRRIRAVTDQYVRRMEVPGPNGWMLMKMKGSSARNKWARFRNDALAFLGGDLSALDKWKGVRIQGHELTTDPRSIQLLGDEEKRPEHFGSEQPIPYAGGAR
jgi:hypothetical protein